MKKEHNKNKIEKEIKPYSIWDTLAESDILIEYMRRFVNSNINNSPELRSDVYEALYNYSTEILPEVEQYYCEKLYLSMKYFLDRSVLCQNLTQ